MENLMNFMLNSLTSAVAIGFIGFIFRSWIIAWVIEKFKASIKHEYDLKMLEVKSQYDLKMLEVESQKEMRLKGEVVAELLAEWIRKDGNLDYHQLNKLCFQAFIWLPKELAEELSDSLSHAEGSKDIRILIKNIRTYLQGKDDGLKAKDVIVFVKNE